MNGSSAGLSGASGSELRRLQQQHLMQQIGAVEAASVQALTEEHADAGQTSLALAVSQLSNRRVLLQISREAASTGSDAATAVLQKLVTRTGSLITTNLARPDGPSSQLTGYLIANELAEQTDFELWAASAASWAQAAVTLLNNATLQTSELLLRAAIQLLDAHLLGGPAGLRLDYDRQVVLPNVPKLGSGLLRLAELYADERAEVGHQSFLLHLLHCIDSQLSQFPSIYRPFSGRVHGIAMHVLLANDAALKRNFDELHCAAARLFIALHVTGASNNSAGRSAGSGTTGSKTTQSQLWAATVLPVLQTMHDAATASTSTFLRASGGSTARTGDRLPLSIPEEDSHESHAGLVSTYLHLNSVLHVILSRPTVAKVPIPLTAILSSALDLLTLGPQTRTQPGTDASLYTLQLIDLDDLQVASMSLVALTATACQDGAQPFVAQLVSVLLAFLHRQTSSATLRLSALRTIAVLIGDTDLQGQPRPSPCARLSLDPASRALPKLAQACLAEVSKLLTPSASATDSAAHHSSRDLDGTTRQTKRQRVYESSSLLGQGVAGGPFPGKKAVDFHAASASVAIFGSIFAHLSTNLRPIHADLAQTGCQLLIALAELLLHPAAQGRLGSNGDADSDGARTALAKTTLSTLADILSIASGRLLALASSRALTVFRLARRSESPALQDAATKGMLILDQVVHPRIPSLLPLRHATEADIGAEAGSWGDEERRLGEVHADNVRGFAEREAMGLVLDIGTAPSLPQALEASHASSSLKRPASSALSPSGATNETIHALQHHHQQHQHPHVSGSAPLQLNGAGGRASPDPVKPFHRPSTPRIGSPSPTRKAFGERSDESRLPETPSKRTSEVMIAAKASVRSSADLEEDVEEGGAVAIDEEESEGAANIDAPVKAASQQPTTTLPVTRLISTADDSEDDEMPEIDMGSDEEEDE